MTDDPLENPQGKHVCFVCGEEGKPLERGICADCWEQARRRAEQEDDC